MTSKNGFKRFCRDTSGTSAILLAAAMPALVGASAFAVDLGSLYLAERKLQGLADSTALSLSQDDFGASGESAVREIIEHDGSDNVRIVGLVPGTYTPDPALGLNERFTAAAESGEEPDAVLIQLEQQVPLSFGTIITGNAGATVQARAVASRRDLAAFSIGTRLTNLGGNLPNAILSALAGSNLNLSTDQIGILANTRVDLFAVADRIAASEGLTGMTYQQIFDHEVDPAVFLAAVGEASGQPDVTSTLAGVAALAGGAQLSLGEIADPGTLGRSDLARRDNPLTLDAYVLTRAALQQAQGDVWAINLGLDVPGISAANLRMTGTNSTEQSPMMTVTAARDVVLHSGSARAYLETRVGTAVPGLASINLPFYLDIAPGEARLTDISCAARDADIDGAMLAVRASIGSAAIGQVDPAGLEDFGQDLAVAPAQLIRTALISATGSAQLDLGGNAEQEVFFTINEVEAHTAKSVFTSDAVSSLSASLANDLDLSVRALGLGVNTSGVGTLVGTTLASVAPTIDSLLNTAMRSTGIGLGVSDVAVDRVRCGMPMLVG